MKFSKETLDILKNFYTINQSIQFEEGNVIRTISPSKSIVAIAEVEEEFPSNAAIYDLSQFLSVLSLFESPEVDFEDRNFKITGGKSKDVYPYVDPGMILTPKKKTVEFPTADVVAKVTNDDFARVIKAAQIKQLPDIAFVGDGEYVKLQALDAEGASQNTFEVEIGETSEEFRAVISAANLKLIPQTYDVEISKRGISKFVGENKVVYYIAVNSKYSNMG